MANELIEQHFGTGFDLGQGCEEIEDDKNQYINNFCCAHCRETVVMRKTFRNYSVDVYTDGRTKTIRLERNLSNHSFAERAYDDFVYLYLIHEENGKVWALYAEAGFGCQKIIVFPNVSSYPDELENLVNSTGQ